ncbi:MAG: hypothetical protein J6V03_00160 [Clostridia bacterium]|nr:hypothetical protein [Clostridia bacterium]
MKNTIQRINKTKNKYPVKLVASLVLSLLVMLFVPSGFIVIKKLGNTLFFLILTLGIYFILSIPSFLFGYKRGEKYNIVEDFYNVVDEAPASFNQYKTLSVTVAEAVKEKTKVIPWTAKNVIIGTVRNDVQLEYILKNNCYYTPARFVSSDNLPIKSIVIYEEDDKGNSIIKRKANVVKHKLVSRKSIPVPMSRKNGDEKYWFFNLEGWEELKKPIIVKDTYRGQPLFTNEYLVENCKYSYQLVSVNSKIEYDLSQNIENILEAGTKAEYKINNKRFLAYSDDKLFIKNNRVEVLCTVSSSDYINRPKLMFERISKYIKK